MKFKGSFLVLVLLKLLVVSQGFIWGNRKVHCAVSIWSEWSAWTSNEGHRTRTRQILRKPQNGGSSCPLLSDTQYKEDPWNTTKSGISESFLVGQKIVINGEITLKPRDLLFMVDMSGSISVNDWSSTKAKLADLIGEICGSIGRGRQNNRIAVITFSSEVVLNFDFQTHWSLESVRQAILGMKQARRATCTGKAFAYAHKYLYDPSSGVREATDSVKDVLVLTDGHSNCGPKLSREVNKLQIYANVYALAIGNYHGGGRKEIESMVSMPLLDHLFSLKNFIEFRNMVNNVSLYPADCAPFLLSK